MKSPDKDDAAEAKFKKKQLQLLDGQKAMAEHEAARQAVNAKTARLRALRLARDAAAAASPAKPAKVRSTKKKSD